MDLGNGVKEWTPAPGEIHQKGTQQSATNFGNEDMGILEGNLIAATNAIHLRLIQESVDDLRGQVLTATLTNSLKYPATNSAKTITLPITRSILRSRKRTARSSMQKYSIRP